MSKMLTPAILLLIFNLASASRILFLFPTPSKSHMVIVHALSTELAQRGHNVTVFSPFPLNKQVKNHREFETPISTYVSSYMHALTSGEMSKVQMMFIFPHVGISLAEDMIHTPAFQGILGEEFDLIIIGLTSNNFLFGFGDHFNCPTAMLSVQRHSSYTNNIIGNSLESNAVNHLFFLSGSLRTFFARVKNFLLNTLNALMIVYIDYYEKVAYDKIFTQPRYRSFEESVRNVSLVLVNDHFSEGSVRPNVPAVVEIRGIQVKPTPDELPKDIKDFLDGARDGAIFFSLGSNIKSEFISESVIDILMSVFTKLKQRVIMKWDANTIKRKPDNVMLGKWLPQDDILAHPNTNLFISHCGLGGVVEAKYHGVPILGLPLFGDQELNCEEIVNEGWSLQLDLKTMSENQLSETIQQLLNNETYSRIAKRFEMLYRDRPMTPREAAVYWIEYVIRHQGAPHMQYLAVHQNFWQRTSLDVLGFLAVCVMIVIKVFGLAVRKLCRRKKSLVGDKKMR